MSVATGVLRLKVLYIIASPYLWCKDTISIETASKNHLHKACGKEKSPLLEGSNGEVGGYTDEGLIRIHHQILTAYEAEDTDIIVFVQNSESTENLIERGAAIMIGAFIKYIHLMVFTGHINYFFCPHIINISEAKIRKKE